MSHDALKSYLSAIEQALKAGNATEHTHRPALKALLEEIGGRDARATNEPRQIECGAPDFIVNRGMVPLGYVEAKDVGIDSVGVLWGNGTTEEFVAAGATAVVDSYGALLQWIKGD